jgi:hypothetical protein
MNGFRLIIYVGFAILVIGGALTITGTIQNWIDNQLFGDEHCFESKYQQDIELIFRDAGIKITKNNSESLCFRTKDTNKVAIINQQIQDRKYKENLEQIKSNERITNIGIIIGAIVLVIIIIGYFASRPNNSYGGIW